MTTSRNLFYFLAGWCAAWGIASLILLDFPLPDAGLEFAACALCFLVAEAIGYCSKQRMRHGRDNVWARRDSMFPRATYRDENCQIYPWCSYFPHDWPVSSSQIYRPARSVTVIKGGKERRR